MNKLLVSLGLAATVALVGCSKNEVPPETGATTGEHLENAADQAGHDIATASNHAASETVTTIDETADKAAAHAEDAAHSAKEAAKEATAAVAGSIEQGAADVKEKAQQ